MNVCVNEALTAGFTFLFAAAARIFELFTLSPPSPHWKSSGVVCGRAFRVNSEGGGKEDQYGPALSRRGGTHTKGSFYYGTAL